LSYLLSQQTLLKRAGFGGFVSGSEKSRLCG